MHHRRLIHSPAHSTLSFLLLAFYRASAVFLLLPVQKQIKRNEIGQSGCTTICSFHYTAKGTSQEPRGLKAQKLTSSHKHCRRASAPAAASTPLSVARPLFTLPQTPSPATTLDAC